MCLWVQKRRGLRLVLGYHVEGITSRLGSWPMLGRALTLLHAFERGHRPHLHTTLARVSLTNGPCEPCEWYKMVPRVSATYTQM